MRRLGLRLPILLPVLLSFFLPSLLAGCGFGTRSDILILTRAGDPLSRAIAESYAEARGVPAEQILELSLSSDADAVEIDAETYLREIAAPIETHLKTADPDREIAVLITTRGLPLRIGHCDPKAVDHGKNCQSAAVDAALAQLGRTSDEALAFRPIENPFFRSPRSFEAFRRDSPQSPLRFLVARLSARPDTGDSPDGVPRALLEMIDREPPAASKTAPPPPLWRVVSEHPPSTRTHAAAALLDPIASQLPLFGHRVCDACAALAEGDRASGLVLQSEAVDAPDALERLAGQVGGQLAHPGIVIRLDRASVDRSPRGGAGSALDRFVTYWFSHGAAVISTHLSDPSLANVTRPTEFLTALARGSSAVEAHFKSIPQLGWGNIFIGDPLVALADEQIPDEDSNDQDLDGVVDAQDNCRDDPNPNQRDSNADGLGNLCDADVNDDGRVDTSWGTIYPVDQRGDLEAVSLTARNGPYDPNHDLDGDGRVDERDVIRTRLWLFRRPGRPDEGAAVSGEGEEKKR